MEPERYQTALSADLSEFIETVTDMSGEEELEQTLDAVLDQTRLACMADAASMLLVSGRTITVAAASHDLAGEPMSCR